MLPGNQVAGRRGLRGAVRASVIACLIIPIAGCATKRDVRDLQANIVELHAQQQALLREVQREQRIQQDSLGSLARSAQETRAESARRMTNIEDHLLRIQELTGLSQQQLAALRDQMERDRDRGVGFGFPGGGDPGSLGGGSDTAENLYDAAITQFRRGSFSTARMGLQEVVERFGSHPLAPEARYYLAEIMVQEGRTEDAIRAFLEIPEYHPGAQRVPDALYRVGLLHLEAGNRADAVDHLERVVNTWPESGAAELAREVLRDIG